MKRPDRLALWIVCGLSLLAAGLRLMFIDMPMRGDEAWNFTAFASKPLAEGLSAYWAFNNHLLNTLLMHLAYVTFGNEPIWLRLPAFFAGVMVVPAAYAVSRAYYGALTGMLAAALVTAASAMIEYSVNARGYMPMMLAFLLLLLIARQLRRGGSRRDWAAFAILTALGFYALPIMVYPFAVVVGWLGLTYLIEARGARRWRLIGRLAAGCVATGVLTLILYAPPLIYLSRLDPSVVTDFDNVVPRSAALFFSTLGANAASIWTDSWMRDLPGIVRVVLAAGIIAGVALHWRLTRYPVPLLLAAVISLTPIILLQRPENLGRVWLFLLPLVLIASAAGLVGLTRLIVREKRLLTALVAAGSIIAAVGLGALVTHKTSIYADRETGNDMRHPAEAFEAVRALVLPGDVVIACPTCLNVFAYYADKAGAPLDRQVYITYVGALRSTRLPEPLPTRLLVVTDYPVTPAQVEAEVLTPLGVDLARYGSPVLVETFDETNQVYEVRQEK